MNIPAALKKTLQNEAGGLEWLEQLPGLVGKLRTHWDLELAEPYPDGNVSCAIPATQHGTPVVLKIQWPHDECEFEADALRLWGGDGAVRLLDHDANRHALLLERCEPGSHLSKATDTDRIGVMIELLPKLWKPASTPFRTLSEESQHWRNNLLSRWLAAGKPCEKQLIDTTLAHIDWLKDSQLEQVLIHQDLHGDNVLASSRDNWLAIDPKPLIGERAFALSPVIRSYEFGDRKKDAINRLYRMSDELELDLERVRGWAVAQSIAWSFGSDFAERHYETARWMLE